MLKSCNFDDNKKHSFMLISSNDRNSITTKHVNINIYIIDHIVH